MEINTSTSSNKEKKEEFKIEFNEIEEDDDEYEKTLEKDIEKNCDLNIYVNKFELDEKSDGELLQMEKHEIIDFKNYQIQKLKAYIISLEKEKEDLIENFKNTTNVLIDKIKESEFRESGTRPETPFIAKKLKTTGITNGNGVNNFTPNSNPNITSYNSSTINQNTNPNIRTYSNNNRMNSSGYTKSDVEIMNRMFGGDMDDEESKGLSKNIKLSNLDIDFDYDLNSSKTQRCPQCTKEFPSELFLQHSLDCLRNKMRCKKCNELIEEKYKKEHVLEWRSKEKILSAITSKNNKLLQQCLDHGASPNKIINEETGDTILHVLSQNGEYSLIETLISTELNINATNKNQDTPLISAINLNQSRVAKLLIDLGADLSKRNASDMSALMIACQRGLVEIAKYLIDNKAEVNEKASISGMTPLTLCKDEELSLYLIKNGAKLQGRPGSSALKK